MYYRKTSLLSYSRFMLETAMDWWQSYIELEDLQEDIYALMRKVSNKTAQKKPTSNLPGIRPIENRDYHEDDHREMTDQRYREGADRYAAELYQKFINSPNAMNEMKHRSDDSKDYLNP